MVWEEISSASDVVDSCGVLSLGVGIGGYFKQGERTSELVEGRRVQRYMRKKRIKKERE